MKTSNEPRDHGETQSRFGFKAKVVAYDHIGEFGTYPMLRVELSRHDESAAVLLLSPLLAHDLAPILSRAAFAELRAHYEADPRRSLDLPVQTPRRRRGIPRGRTIP